MPAVEMPWRKLVESIKRGNCILILGPQVSFDPNNSDYLPLTTALAHRLADHAKLKESKDLINRNDLAHVAQLFKQATDRYELEIAASDFYSAYQAVTTDFHRDLAALPFTLCINAAPDDLFSNSVIEAGKKSAQDYYNFRRHRPPIASQPNSRQPYIYNLYGHYSDAESLVLTEDDLLEFLANIIKASPELPPLIRSQVADLSKNFLFIGFGFRSWHQRILLHALKAQNRSYESLAVEDKQFFDLPDCSQTAVFYSHLHKIKFECYSWLDFARELRQAYGASVKTAIPTQQVMTDAPKVFLCYASEDRGQVGQLCLKLRNLGIEPWQDKQNLRAGDNWDRQLVHVINQQVNYVIVVQTPAM
ncbi:MAG: TIR domain-containing protein, partial [Nitrosomonas sp.]